MDEHGLTDWTRRVGEDPRSAGLTLSDLVRLRGADQPSDTSMYCILSWVVWYPTSRAITAPVSACRCPWVHPSQFS